MANSNIKRTQISKTNDDNNCTVMALKSVTGWKETKCQNILRKAGRVNDKGFNIMGYLDKCKGIIEDVKLTKVNDVNYYKHYSTRTLKNFATHRNKGVYYIVTNTHALAIIDGIIVDNLSGRGASDRREVKYAYKVTGNINPNTGIVTKEDTEPIKRYPRLHWKEKVIFLGDEIKYENKILAKKGDLIIISTQQTNGTCIANFYYKGKKVVKTPNGTKYTDSYSITAKIDRSLLQTTKEREVAKLGEYINPIK